MNRKEQTLEVLVFLLLIVPSMVLSLLAFQHEKATFAFVAISVMLRDISLVLLILFFLWRNRESNERIGLTFKHGWREIGLGILLYIPFAYLAAVLERVFLAAGLTVPSGPIPMFLTPKGPADIALAVVLVIVVAISEEIIFRGYLIRRLSAATQNCAVGLILAAIIFSMGHGYEGTAGMATVGMMGIFFALVYLWRKSLVAAITMHFLQDFISIVLVQSLGKHAVDLLLK
jgi:membrane protease YdiL (CAAX protease family)